MQSKLRFLVKYFRLMFSDGTMDNYAYTKDQSSKVEGNEQNTNTESKDKSKNAQPGAKRRKFPVTGEFDSLHIETCAERMDHLKQEIDSCQQR
jgi:hypothetical protein